MEENKSTTYTVYRVARKKRDIRQKEPTISQGSVVTLLKSGKLYDDDIIKIYRCFTFTFIRQEWQYNAMCNKTIIGRTIHLKPG